MDKTIVVLGSGIGGIVAARELRRHLGTEHRILLIDKEALLAFPASFLWVMIGWRTAEAIRKPLSLVEKYGIEYRTATVEEISTARRTVRAGGETIPFDYLIIALGADTDAGTEVSSPENRLTFYTLGGAEDIFRRIGALRSGLVSIVIGGLPHRSPPAPYEAAFLLDSYFRRRTAGISIRITTPEQYPLSVLGAAAGDTLKSMLSERSIELRTNTANETEADLSLYIPTVVAPRVVAAAQLTDGSGWIPVNSATLETKHENIFAIGDNTRIAVKNGLEIPKIGVFAAAQAEVVAHIIARRIHQREVLKNFNGTGYCFLETGNGRAGYIHADFYASPEPKFIFHEASVGYHWAKVVYEKYWLWRWF